MSDSASEPPLVVVSDLHVRYGKTDAVRKLSFTIGRGEIFGFIGPNGAGKTSTIKVLATLLKPSLGTATVGGVDVAQHPEIVRRKIGYMPDFFGVYEDLTASEYLHFFAAAYHIPTGQRPGLIRDVLALTDLTEKHDAPVDGLSRGMKQRLSLARVLLHDPELLLLDEPASGLDPRARIEMRELLKELQSMGKTIIVSSHILHELAQFCSHIGIIEAGRMVANGSLRDIYRALSLRRIIHLQLANSSPELLTAMRALPEVAEVEEQPDRLAVQLHEDQSTPEDFLAALHTLGARVRMFQPDAMDMETAFMKLTEGKVA
ncbi:ABC transporter-related protein [Chthoniobacter flavus Ellin428]|uniref:ABC transporter-related protein n=1 Tax=Chthoniobacter flavus Ellin428 TaxID=497964 RepID=B4D8C2_9BACT|nr:ABC transporter ATP-binding protein [Chthoniobacter flavus]EDY17315.1 ABC transporter-related protein [Chthoniobacter flavus Ellin428]TCO90114.1 ABC-2 type transport system ATP-binding protein [Chthoniobacter flavus]